MAFEAQDARVHFRRWPLEIAGADRAPARFDVVALPGTLTSTFGPRGAGSARRFVDVAHALLAPGGVVVGHLDHVTSVRGIQQLLSGGHAWQRMQAWRGFETAGRCIDSLEGAGFQSAECFFVEPRITDPLALVSSADQAARSHFVRVVRRNRPLYSPAGYRMRIALARVGLGGLLQPHLFFCARKAC